MFEVKGVNENTEADNSRAWDLDVNFAEFERLEMSEWSIVHRSEDEAFLDSRYRVLQ